MSNEQEGNRENSQKKEPEEIQKNNEQKKRAQNKGADNINTVQSNGTVATDEVYDDDDDTSDPNLRRSGWKKEAD